MWKATWMMIENEQSQYFKEPWKSSRHEATVAGFIFSFKIYLHQDKCEQKFQQSSRRSIKLSIAEDNRLLKQGLLPREPTFKLRMRDTSDTYQYFIMNDKG